MYFFCEHWTCYRIIFGPATVIFSKCQCYNVNTGIFQLYVKLRDISSWRAVELRSSIRYLQLIAHKIVRWLVRRKSHRFSSWTVRYVNPNCHVELEIHSYFNCCCNLLFNLPPPPPLNKNWTPVPWAVDFDILDIIIRYLVRLSRLWTYRKKCYKTLYIFTILALSKATSVRRALQIRLLNVTISEDFSWSTLTSNV